VNDLYVILDHFHVIIDFHKSIEMKFFTLAYLNHYKMFNVCLIEY